MSVGANRAVPVALGRPRALRLALAYLELTKPRIVMLVVMTGVPALLLAAQGMPRPGLFVGTLLGTMFASMSAAAFNHYVDRDIDGLMLRTRTRPLPSGTLPASHALALGFGLMVLSWSVLLVAANALAALLAMISIFYYAVVYSVWLKRRTPQNIVIGGGAGASAPLIAWVAVTGGLALPAWLLAGIVFLWTPPHFWSLALYRREDYLRAGIPMLPVTHGEPETRRQILLYACVLVPVTLSLTVLGVSGPIYGIGAAALGALFLASTLRLRRSGAVPDAVRTFRFSILYLFLLYVLMTVDAAVRFLGRPVGG
ncbi:MAG: heme o synthase [Candidatus Eisenbacteria bacterium]